MSALVDQIKIIELEDALYDAYLLLTTHDNSKDWHEKRIASLKKSKKALRPYLETVLTATRKREGVG
jgi:hypothetical protein